MAEKVVSGGMEKVWSEVCELSNKWQAHSQGKYKQRDGTCYAAMCILAKYESFKAIYS